MHSELSKSEKILLCCSASILCVCIHSSYFNCDSHCLKKKSHSAVAEMDEIFEKALVFIFLLVKNSLLRIYVDWNVGWLLEHL